MTKKIDKISHIKVLSQNKIIFTKKSVRILFNLLIIINSRVIYLKNLNFISHKVLNQLKNF